MNDEIIKQISIQTVATVIGGLILALILLLVRRWLINYLKNKFIELKNAFRKFIELSRLRTINKKLIPIVKSIESLFDTNKSCSLYILTSHGQGSKLDAQIRIDTIMYVEYILRDWYKSYLSTITHYNPFGYLNIFDEFGFLLLHIQRLVEGIVKLLDENKRQHLKNDSYGYPLLKEKFNKASANFSELAKDNVLGSVKKYNWDYITLPDL